MNLRPSDPENTLSFEDVERVERLLKAEYFDANFTSMRYKILGENKFLLEYMINFFDNGNRTQFYREVIKKDEVWELAEIFITIPYTSDPSSADLGYYNVDDRIQEYLDRNNLK